MIRRGQFCNISGGIILLIVLMTERRGCCVFAPMAEYFDKDDYNDKDNIVSYYNDENTQGLATQSINGQSYKQQRVSHASLQGFVT